MNTLNVNLGQRSYPIYIGSDLLRNNTWLSQHIPTKQVMIVTNETVAPLYLDALLKLLGDIDCQNIILPDGEIYKTLDTVNLIYTALLTHRFDRDCTLIALGGGVIGDMTGFAAATYQRGVNFIQVPTTLLAQVDSSVGGKTGVNHSQGKNMIGAFYQPRCVLADTNTLDTLADKEFSAGMAEVIKYGIIRDPEFFLWLENNMSALLQRDKATLSYAIERSCQNKAEVVAADEYESGVRALLNLGHTFGHAIEAGMGYGNWLHGEAVAVGMCMAADLSYRSGWIDKGSLERITQLIAKANLPVNPPAELTPDKYLELMSVDKKVKLGKIHFVLLKNIGQAFVSADYDGDLLWKTLNFNQQV